MRFTLSVATLAAVSAVFCIVSGYWGAPNTRADESTPNGATPRTRTADNSVCHVCHLNYEEEPLAAVHARHNIGCTKCHGDSWDHADDEENVTPPDVMFPAKAIDDACRKCHKTHDVQAVDVVVRWRERCIDKQDLGAIVCTDCHGQHRLKKRTVRWNRETGQLFEEPK